MNAPYYMVRVNHFPFISLTKDSKSKFAPQSDHLHCKYSKHLYDDDNTCLDIA